MRKRTMYEEVHYVQEKCVMDKGGDTEWNYYKMEMNFLL